MKQAKLVKRIPKDIRKYVRLAINQGMVLEDRGRHFKLSWPHKPGAVTISRSPSDYRAVQAVKQELKKVGVNLYQTVDPKTEQRREAALAAAAAANLNIDQVKPEAEVLAEAQAANEVKAEAKEVAVVKPRGSIPGPRTTEAYEQFKAGSNEATLPIPEDADIKELNRIRFSLIRAGGKMGHKVRTKTKGNVMVGELLKPPSEAKANLSSELEGVPDDVVTESVGPSTVTLDEAKREFRNKMPTRYVTIKIEIDGAQEWVEEMINRLGRR